MKYKRMALAACALLLLLSATNLSAVLTDEHPRYHQHLERPAYTPCADHGEDLLCSHLPLVLIDTGGAEIPGVPIRDGDGSRSNDTFTTTADGGTLLRASVSVVDHAEGNNHPADAPTLQSTIDIRVRGNSSRYFDKHSYLVKTLTDDGAASRDVAMLGMDAFDEWALHGPYLDKTLIRNYMWYNLAGEIMDYAPNVRFCEVLLNGVYQGLYVMTETVSSGADARLKLTEPSKDTVQTSYALRLDRGSGNEVKNIETFSQYALRNLQDMDIVYPGTKWLTPERAAWIAQDFSDFEKSLYSYDYDTEPYAWWEQADMSSFVDYFILNEFTCNYDAGWLSTYIYRDVRGKYKMCIWDFNSACDNYSHPGTEPQHFELQHNVWYYMLSKDEDFMNAVDYMFAGLEKRKPDCFAVKQYKKYKLASGKTAKSILISCGARLAPFDIPQLREVMAYDELELDRIGDRKTAVFFIISDTTQTYNFLVALAFSQMFNLLCERADNVHGGRLPHHVRVLWDEAANTGQVPQLEKLVAVIRSREVSLCLLYQQLAQCKAIYDKHAETILGNMDSVVFLGGREASTIKEISENWLGKATISMQTDSRSRGQSESYSQNTQRLGRELMTPAELATMPGDKCILQLRGLPPFFSPKYDLKRHPNYRYTAEADKQKNAFDLDRLINRRRRPGLNEACTMYEVAVPDDALTEEDEDILNYDDIDDPDAFA